MYFVSFVPPKVIEFRDVRLFLGKVRAWLHRREGENSYVITTLPRADQPPDPTLRMFLVEQDKQIVAVGILSATGVLCLSWATPEAVGSLVDHAVRNQWKILGTCAPAHISRDLAQAISERTQQCFSLLRTERIFQITHPPARPIAQGHLEVARPADKLLVRRWFEGFVEETGFIGDVVRDPRAVDWLIDPRRLYLWKAPEPVAMAAWVAPATNSGSINYVYVPPEHRGKGFGKAVTAALAEQMLASGLRYCFIFADAGDARTNHVYHTLGANTVTDLQHFAISPHVTGKKCTTGEFPAGNPCPAASGQP